MDQDHKTYITVYTTAANKDQAKVIAQKLIEEHLAACVTVLGEVQSFYPWEGKLAEGTEISMLIKTRAELFDQVAACIKRLHTYKMPCIVAWPIVQGDSAYLNWVSDNTQPHGT